MVAGPNKVRFLSWLLTHTLCHLLCVSTRVKGLWGEVSTDNATVHRLIQVDMGRIRWTLDVSGDDDYVTSEEERVDDGEVVGYEVTLQ